MFYFPFVDLVERLLAWANKLGSRVYWTWAILIGVLGYITRMIWLTTGIFPNYMAVIMIIVWAGGWYPIMWYETHYWKGRKKK